MEERPGPFLWIRGWNSDLPWQAIYQPSQLPNPSVFFWFCCLGGVGHEPTSSHVPNRYSAAEPCPQPQCNCCHAGGSQGPQKPREVTMSAEESVWASLLVDCQDVSCRSKTDTLGVSLVSGLPVSWREQSGFSRPCPNARCFCTLQVIQGRCWPPPGPSHLDLRA